MQTYDPRLLTPEELTILDSPATAAHAPGDQVRISNCPHCDGERRLRLDGFNRWQQEHEPPAACIRELADWRKRFDFGNG